MKKYIVLLAFFSGIFWNLQAQSQEKIQRQLDDILEQKARCLTQNRTKFFYYIQIYNGKDIQQARELLREYINRHPDSKAFIKWESPEYKVWTGEYMNVMDVEKAMQLLQEEYPNALIVYPKVH